jgi:anti-sigma-K factor RskA
MSERADISGGDEDWDLLAAEYVLGTLDGLERDYIARQAAGNATLALMIADWQTRLEPLIRLTPPVPPPADLWRRIDRATRAAPKSRNRFWQRLGFWRGATVGGFALAAALAVFVVIHPPIVAQSIAALAPLAGGAPVLVAETTSDGKLRLQPLTPLTVAAGRDLELWSLPAGATRPQSLGVLPAAGITLASLAEPKTQLLVSLEPQGGSPTGQPTGPVLYGGTLTKIE